MKCLILCCVPCDNRHHIEFDIYYIWWPCYDNGYQYDIINRIEIQQGFVTALLRRDHVAISSLPPHFAQVVRLSNPSLVWKTTPQSALSFPAGQVFHPLLLREPVFWRNTSLDTLFFWKTSWYEIICLLTPRSLIDWITESLFALWIAQIIYTSDRVKYLKDCSWKQQYNKDIKVIYRKHQDCLLSPWFSFSNFVADILASLPCCTNPR